MQIELPLPIPLAGLAPAYAEFFDCFNRGKYFQAHSVLESLWLPRRRDPMADFYQGLIQLAGAFVHVEKGRLRPAIQLLDLAERNLAKYPEVCEQLNVVAIRQLIQQWKTGIEKQEASSH